MNYKNEFSTYRIAYALSKSHLWNALLNLYFLFSAIAHQKKAPAIAQFSIEKQGDRFLFGYGGDRLCKCFANGGAIALQKKAPVIA
jgi:hypothetical protein